VWNYLQSYESTDDAQIDGHIDPLSSRINGTVIRVRPENNDRVKAGELLVEIDPRDYEVAVAQAKARLELAIAQVASAKQDYAASLANVRQGDADNFRAKEMRIASPSCSISMWWRRTNTISTRRSRA